MFLLKKVSILLVSAIATGLVTACNNSNTGNSNVSMPAIDTTKVSPTATSTSKPSPAIDDKLPDLKIGELEPYKHRSSILAMDVPKGWKVVDSSQVGEILVTWTEKAGRALISANIFVPPSEIPESRLSEVFESIVKGMYGNQQDFSMRSPVVEATGNIAIEWTSTVSIGNQKLKFQANSKLQRINNKFAILTYGAIEPKFTEIKDYFVKIANSQVINDNLAIP